MSRPSTEHLPPSVLSDYQARRLAPPDVLVASDHLAGCAVCRQELARLAAARGHTTLEADFAAKPSDGSPTFSELAACLDGELDTAQTAELRRLMEAEPSLAAELADLEAFRRETAALAPRVFDPDGVEKQKPVPAPHRAKIIAFPVQRWAALAAAAMVIAYVSWQMVFPGQKHLARQLWSGTGGSPVALDDLPADLRNAVERAAALGELTPPASLPRAAPGRRDIGGPIATASRFLANFPGRRSRQGSEPAPALECLPGSSRLRGLSRAPRRAGCRAKAGTARRQDVLDSVRAVDARRGV